MNRLAVCLIVLVATGLGWGQEATQTVKVLSYNVQFLPGLGQLFNARGNDGYRPGRLGEVLAEMDIIGLNEVFELKPRKALLAEIETRWGKDYHAYECPEPPLSVGKYNAGLAIVSRFPIVATHHRAYSKTSLKSQFGVFADEFAAKGALHARLRMESASGPIEIDVFTTHLDSKLADVRASQFVELSDFIAEHADPSNPTIVMGDMNTRGNPPYQTDPQSAYHTMMNRYRKARPDLVDVWLERGEGDGGTSEQTEPSGGNRIDYVLFSSGKGKGRLEPTAIRVEPFLDPKVVALSDHSAVEVIFDVKP